MLRRPPVGSGRGWLPGALLVATLALTVALAYEANDAAQSHRAAAQRTLQDYASVAAWQFVRNVKLEMRNAMTDAFRPVLDLGQVRAGSAVLPPPSVLATGGARVAACDPGGGARAVIDTARYYFRVDPAPGQSRATIVISGAAPGGDVADRVADTVMAHLGARSADGFELVPIFRRVGDQLRSLVFVVLRAPPPQSAPVAAYGFEMCTAAFGAPLFRQVMRSYALLPPSLTGQVPVDSLLALTIVDSSGQVVFQSDSADAPAPAAEGGFAVGKGIGTLATRVTLRPRAAERLVAGGVPPSRLPRLLALVTLAAALVAIALFHLRRERELQRLRADFISGVSHELRTPLAQIRMFGETLRLGRVRSEDERRRSLEIIDQEARRLAHLVENVLQFSASEREPPRLSPESSDVGEQIRDALAGFAPIGLARGTVISVSVEAGLSARLDRGAFRQMLVNLLDNAVKYGPVGQEVAVAAVLAAGHARVTVDDEGEGVPDEARERIWEPFARLDRDDRPAIGGSGIGLAVVRELADAHGGRAWVERSPAGGARFVLELPAAWIAAPRLAEQPA
jgi:signal transduction histidine kinase